MIPDSQTNFIYLADTLCSRFSAFYNRFTKVLNDEKIPFQPLPGTKDIWAVDYMPIQIERDKFVRFTYNPSYLKPHKLKETISNTDAICKQIGIETIESNIVLDGGNVIKSKNKVILTERIFKENPGYERKQLIKELEGLFEVDKIFIIPEQPNDFTGHADGMVRFVDEETILINDYSLESVSFQKGFAKAIQQTGFKTITIPYNPYGNSNNDQAQGCYINYLQLENHVIVPTFGMQEDEAAVKQFQEIFKGQTISTIDSNEIAEEGGVLNCITWNILKE